MVREAPGFLAKLIALCPQVVAHINKLDAPAKVLEATREMFEENDLAGQFREDMLTDTPGAHLALNEAQASIEDWLAGMPSESEEKKTGVVTSVTQNYHEKNKQMTQILAGLRAKFVYKRLRLGDLRRGRKVFHFLDVSLRP